MKSRCVAAALLAVAFQAFAAVDQATIVADREMPVYQCGQTAKFQVTGMEGGQLAKSGKYLVQIHFCGGKVMRKVPVDFAIANPATVDCTLDEPGFVLLRLLDENSKLVLCDKRAVQAGAAFEPEKIRKVYAMPPDFREFWEAGRKKVAGNPVELRKDEKRSNAKYTVYHISVKSLYGETLTGYLTIPAGPGPFPAFITVPGAGPGGTGPAAWANRGVITLMMNVHKFPTADNSAEQKRRYLEDTKNGADPYQYRGMGDREKYFYYSVFLGLDRAIDHVAKLKEWDGKHMVFFGSSQGGGSAIILAALNPHITAISANVPALCDHAGFRVGRESGWPKFCYRPGRETLDSYAPYFDAANFAALVKVPALVSCGFIDTTCSPSSVYAAYNELAGEKRMFHMPLNGHVYSVPFQKVSNEFVREHLGL